MKTNSLRLNAKTTNAEIVAHLTALNTSDITFETLEMMYRAERDRLRFRPATPPVRIRCTNTFGL